MRKRIERKLLKRLRIAQHGNIGHAFVETVRRYQHNGRSLGVALHAIVADHSAGWLIRGEAARLLHIAHPALVTKELLKQFFSLQGKDELWEAALTLEQLGDTRAVVPLIGSLNDVNHHRRHAAARALGWIRKPGRRAVDALIDVLSDAAQPLAVREEAAESLAYLHSSRAVPALVSALSDPNVGIRFWAVFALGSIRNRRTFRHTDRRVVPALESMLADHAVPPGDWWSVSREALAMIGHLDPAEARYREQLAQEIDRVVADPNATAEDRRWAESYRSASPPRVGLARVSRLPPTPNSKLVLQRRSAHYARRKLRHINVSQLSSSALERQGRVTCQLVPFITSVATLC